MADETSASKSDRSTRPIVWAIGGSDSGGGAGIQADTRTMHGLGGHACTIVTAVTAQSSRGVASVSPVAPEVIAAQWRALAADLPPAAIKIGMLPEASQVRALSELLEEVDAPVILDPVLRASAGGMLSNRDAIIEHLTSRVDVITPNLAEAAALVGVRDIATPGDVENAARAIAARGPRTVVIKGGHAEGPLAQDCVLHDGRILWLSNDRADARNTHGTGCTFASATAAAIASGMSVVDAIVVAKMFVTAAIRGSYAAGAGEGPVAQGGWPEDEADLPWLTSSADAALDRTSFPPLDGSLGLYAIVDSAEWVERLAGSGVGAMQLRVKTLTGDALRDEIRRAIESARNANVPLFINDYWQHAIELGAFGVHLGQEDLDTADLDAIRAAALRLGVSTHSYEEVARAHALRPSYMAVGPIFETKIKVMKFAPQGIAALRRWRRTLRSYPLVAIGGIDASTIAEVAAAGPDAVAVIRAITLTDEPHAAVRELTAELERGRNARD